jgi:hypothetical protein
MRGLARPSARPSLEVTLGMSADGAWLAGGAGARVIWILVDDVSRTKRIALGLWALVSGAVMLVDALDVRQPRPGRVS